MKFIFSSHGPLLPRVGAEPAAESRRHGGHPGHLRKDEGEHRHSTDRDLLNDVDVDDDDGTTVEC